LSEVTNFRRRVEKFLFVSEGNVGFLCHSTLEQHYAQAQATSESNVLRGEIFIARGLHSSFVGCSTHCGRTICSVARQQSAAAAAAIRE
jgi:hypothetical protein